MNSDLSNYNSFEIQPNQSSNLIQNEIFRLLLCEDTSVSSKTLYQQTKNPYTLKLYSSNGHII